VAPVHRNVIALALRRVLLYSIESSSCGSRGWYSLHLG
jgi:hypothetical protein